MQLLQHGLGELPTLLGEVDAVASKTKLLGFNAAILAAQAGREGRSFAIVAEQMKALNQRAEASTRKLHLLVDGLQRALNRANRALTPEPTYVGTAPAERSTMTTPRPELPKEVPEVPAIPERPQPEVREVPSTPHGPEIPAKPPELPETPGAS